MISVSIVIEADENRKVVQSYILSLISFSDPDHELQLPVKCSKWAESEGYNYLPRAEMFAKLQFRVAATGSASANT